MSWTVRKDEPGGVSVVQVGLIGLLSMGMWMSPASHAEARDVSITVQVVDEAGSPVATAVLRHPEEAVRHQVNRSTGEWTGSALYGADGSERLFTKGMTVEFEVSAPAYAPAHVSFDVRKRRNHFVVLLEEIELVYDTDAENVVVQFGRDKPID